MKPETIRIIDIRVGRIICFILTCLRRFLDTAQSAKKPLPPVKKILFIKLIEQGATVLAAGAIRRAAAMVGQENIFFLVFDENKPILEIMALVPRENILVIRNGGFFTFLRDILSGLLVIRRQGIDAVIDMEFFARASAIIAFLTGAKRRVGLHRFTCELPYRGDLMTHRLQHNPYLHTATAYLLLVEALFLPPGEIPLAKKTINPHAEAPPAFRASEEEVQRFRLRLIGEGLDLPAKGPIILINPNASDMLPLRKWPLENVYSLGAALLADDPEARIVITGAPAEQEAARQLSLRWASPRVINLAGKTTLRELLILYTLSDVLVTNDSGPAHFASLTAINSIVLYGPETPKLFGAIGKNTHPLYAKLACSPCVNAFNHRFSPCTDNRCLQSITPEQVQAKIKECLIARNSS